jgi:hypothetical protein
MSHCHPGTMGGAGEHAFKNYTKGGNMGCREHTIFETIFSRSIRSLKTASQQLEGIRIKYLLNKTYK